MAAWGHDQYEGRSIQAPGMMRHGPVPGALGPAVHRPLEPLPHPELLEGKIAAQAAEIEGLLRENRRLAENNENMRQQIGANQQELQRIQSHIGSIRTESDIQARGLVEKIRKMEDDIRAGETVKEELLKAHNEAKSLVLTGQELTGDIQRLTEELKKASGDGKRLPELLPELDGLRQEHQKIRAAFEHTKGSNFEQVERMRSMEKNLITLAREVEKLRADVMSAEKGERVNPYAASYGNPGTGYSLGVGYTNTGFSRGSPAEYSQAYGRPLPQTPGGTLKADGAGYADVYSRYQMPMSSVSATMSGAGYYDTHVKPQVPGASGSVPAGEGMN